MIALLTSNLKTMHIPIPRVAVMVILVTAARVELYSQDVDFFID